MYATELTAVDHRAEADIENLRNLSRGHMIESLGLEDSRSTRSLSGPGGDSVTTTAGRPSSTWVTSRLGRPRSTGSLTATPPVSQRPHVCRSTAERDALLAEGAA